MKKLGITGLVLGAAMTMGVAHAEPMKLTDQQLDQVSAGLATATALATGAAAGFNNAATQTQAQTVALQGIVAQAQSLAASASAAN